MNLTLLASYQSRFEKVVWKVKKVSTEVEPCEVLIGENPLRGLREVKEIQDIQGMPTPKTKSEVRGFLDRVDYIARFIS